MEQCVSGGLGREAIADHLMPRAVAHDLLAELMIRHPECGECTETTIWCRFSYVLGKIRFLLGAAVLSDIRCPVC